VKPVNGHPDANQHTAAKKKKKSHKKKKQWQKNDGGELVSLVFLSLSLVPRSQVLDLSLKILIVMIFTYYSAQILKKYII